uniref:DNA mismatch repair protein Mlh3 isoform X2 n=1 Tax=Pogona vitticeps TaxID=103695 RepID=A0ABM5FAV6_9SAUR
MIKCLTEEVQAKLRSGVAIASLGQCAEELILNSIDAKATCVAVRVDLETLKVQVVDNGCGIAREDLNKVGNRYFTSKCCSLKDLENLKCYGFRGEALASIASMASLLEISSKTSKTSKTFLKMFHNGTGLEVSEAELNRPSPGTTVTVCNLFHHLPVRRKCMDSLLELERMRHKVEAISLVHPSVSFSLRNDTSCSVVLQLSKTKDICSRFSQIYGLGKSQKLREINYKFGGFEISGFISSEGHYNKNIQFLFVNNRIVLRTRLHKLIDFLLRKQSVICKTKSGSSNSSPARHRSGPELYGIFIINVKCRYDDYDVCLEPAKTLIEFRDWATLLTCVEEGVKEFLKREQLFIELCSEDIKEFNEQNNFCLASSVALTSSLTEEKGMQENFKKACDNIMDSYEMFNLQSKSVRRKITLVEASDHTEPISNVERIDVCLDLTGTEPAHELGSNKIENLLSSKNDTTYEFPKLDNLQQEASVPVNQQTESNNSKCPCGEQNRSIVLETNKQPDSLFHIKECDKDTRSQHERVLQQSSLNIVGLGHAGTMEDVNQFNCEFRFADYLKEKYKTVKEGRQPSVVSNTDGKEVVGQLPLKLCSTGLLTCWRQNQPPHKTTEVNNQLISLPKLGPVSANDIFGKRLDFLGQTQNSEECLRITNESISTAITDGPEMRNVSCRKNWVASVPANDSMDFVASHVKELIPAASSGSVHLDSAPHSREMAEPSVRPRSCCLKKLSLYQKLGSLDRFRRHYGNLKSSSSKAALEKKHAVEIPLGGSSLTDDHTDLQNPCIHGIPAASNITCNSPFSLEKSQQSMERSLLNREAFNVSPLTLADYSQIKKNSLSQTQFTGTLASKLSRMKGNLEDVLNREPVEQPLKQPQVCLSQKDKEKNKLTCEKECLLQVSARKEVTGHHYFASPSGEQGTTMGLSSTRTEDVEHTVNHCFIDSDGEYVVPQNRNVALFNKEGNSEGSSETTGIMNGSAKQDMKACECQNVSLSANLEVTDESSAIVNEEKQPHSSSEWLLQFDASLGRTVYINQMTGLSTYCAPSEEPQALCIKDISTMSVNVIENGFQCRCHPFRSDLIVPFLPRPQKERHLGSQDFTESQGKSLQSLFSEWDNPVFAHCPEIAVDVSSGQADSLAVKIHNILYPYRFTKNMIDSMQVLNQVDNKFIACLIDTRADKSEKAVSGGNLLVLVDQHAAHERVRLEQLISDLYEKQPEALGKKKLLASIVHPPLEIEITEDQRRLLRCCRKGLEDLGLELFFPENNLSQVLVGKVPLCFVEREANELRRGRQTVAKGIVQLLQATGGAQGTLPLTIQKVLASQACHGAIKFNYSLTLEESCRLMESLSCCQLPFQCAHGRPSMLPLADIDHLWQETECKPNLPKLRRMAKAWQLFQKEKDSSVEV